MVMLTIVSRLGYSVDLADDRENAARYAEIKARVLPYSQVLLSIGPARRSTTVRQAPLGTVRSPRDAQALIAALVRAFPDQTFVVSVRLFAQMDEVVYLSPEASEADETESLAWAHQPA